MALLRTLRVQNLVIIEDVTVDLGPGLNLLTGETGAGKSILVDALGLVAGLRADRSRVRKGESRAVVEALFEIEPGAAVLAWAEARGVADVDEGQLIVRRELSAEGSGRVLINGSPCTLGLLRELADQLLELHRQQQQRSLLAPERHTELVDRFGEHAPARRRVVAACLAVREARQAAQDLLRRAEERTRRTEGLERTVREIGELDPSPGELEMLERERRVLQNAGRMVELLDQVVGLSSGGEPSAAGLAATAATRADELAGLDDELEEPARRLRSAAVELQDVGEEFRSYRDRSNFDPARLEKIEARRIALERSCQAYGVDEAGLVEERERAEQELQGLESIERELAAAHGAVEAAERAYVESAVALTRKRKASGRKLAAAVQQQLASLALPRARFEVRLEPVSGDRIELPDGVACSLSPGGAERAEFQLAANPGEAMRALAQVASGGELSRVMLALHVVASHERAERVLVFDEVDSGVGGAVADALGGRLGKLAERSQVLCVTHLPQIAAYADRHFSVTKRVQSGRTKAGIAALNGTERVEELARMLGGRRPTAASRRHASELLRTAGREPRAQPRSRV